MRFKAETTKFYRKVSSENLRQPLELLLLFTNSSASGSLGKSQHEHESLRTADNNVWAVRYCAYS
jgi:hypothetical protein